MVSPEDSQEPPPRKRNRPDEDFGASKGARKERKHVKIEPDPIVIPREKEEQPKVTPENMPEKDAKPGHGGIAQPTAEEVATEASRREAARAALLAAEEEAYRREVEAEARGEGLEEVERRPNEAGPSRACPYLDTIDRSVLDFDFEKLCSVSLSHLNVYACLICGKYFQGRGPKTHAYTHSVDTGHRVFLNLATLKFYCLPDGYEIQDSSLDDIKFVLRPTFTKAQIGGIDSNAKLSRAQDNSTYHPGIVGLNNIKANDYCNVVLHALGAVAPLREFFLMEENYGHVKRPVGDSLGLLHQRFGELLRKLYNPRAFKAHVSPHEMLQAVVLCSQKRFQITVQGDAVDFLSWLLNTLHLSLNGNNKTSSSVLYKTFRGRMRAYSKKVLPVECSEDEARKLLASPEYQEEDKELPFLYLTLDLPQAPLYRDELLQNIIPQVPLATLLQKFNGSTEKEYKTYNANIMKRFELIKLPRYLILYIKRFTKNTFFVEKNPTIVNFPIKNVDFFELLAEDARKGQEFTTYDLLANIVHDGKPPGAEKKKRRKGVPKAEEENKEEGSYRVQLLHKASGKWFELQDLHVKEILPQMITLTESYIQLWELNTRKTRDQRVGETDDSLPLHQALAKESE